MSTTLDEVKAVIFDVMKIDTKGIVPENRFVEDLKADSMDQFLLITGISEKFSLNINDEDATSIKTVGDAVNYIETHKI
jgi:acyl carrier protein